MTEQLNVRPMRMGSRPRHSLSIECLVKLSVAALIGTGFFAGLDRLYERADGVQSEPAPQAQGDQASITGPHLDGPLMGEPESLSMPETRLVAGDIPEAPPRYSSSEDVGREGTGSTLSETQASDVEPASLQDSFASATTSEATQDPPGDCLLSELRAVLADVTARFGAVTAVAAHQMKTANHIAGSIREKLHHDCKAIDFRPDPRRVEEIKAYLRGRPEISGVESYRDGVIHIDTGGTPVATRRQPGNSARPQLPTVVTTPPPRTRGAPAAFVLLDRNH
jgi:hypothetical protein